MAVKAKRIVSAEGEDMLPAAATPSFDTVARDAELRAIADEQLAAERDQGVMVLDRIGKGLNAWKAARETAWGWEWAAAVEAAPADWRGLHRLTLLFAELDAIRDRIGYLDAFHKPIWCPACHPGEQFPGNPWTKWDCVEHTTWLAAQALNVGNDLFGGLTQQAPKAPPAQEN